MIRTLELVDQDLAEARSARDAGRVAQLEAERERFAGDGLVRIVGPAAIRLRHDGARSTARTPDRPRVMQPPPTVGPVPVPVPDPDRELVIAPQAYRDMLDQLEADGLEEGGWMYGTRTPGELRVEAFVRTRGEARTTKNVRLSAEQRETMADHYQPLGWELLGCFHTHPTGSIAPSEADRRAFAASADRNGSTWASLVIGPGHSWLYGEDWAKPALAGYLSDPGGDVIEPARTVIEVAA